MCGKSSSLVAFVVAIGLISTVGCFGPTGPKVAQVKGTVLDNGKPVKDAKVAFYPVDGRPSYGSTDSDGHFELEYDGSMKGAVVGTHDVQISTMAMAAPQPISSVAPNQYSKMPKPAIPKQYTWPSEVQVAEGKNDLSFDLKDAKKQ